MANPDYTAQDVPTWAANLDSMNSLKAIGNIKNPLVELPLLNSLAFARGLGSLTFARADSSPGGTLAAYIDRYGVLQTVAIGLPRFEANGLLIEGASTNLVPESDDFSTWSLNGTMIRTGGQADMADGTAAYLLNDTDVDLDEAWIQTPNMAVADDSLTRTVSIRLKEGTAAQTQVTTFLSIGTLVTVNAIITWATKTISIGTLEGPFHDGFYVAKVPITNNSSGNIVWTIRLYPAGSAASVTGSVTAFRAQAEELPFATSPIATAGAPVTRSADSLSLDIAGNIPLQANAQTILVDWDIFGTHPTLDQDIVGVVGETFRQVRGANAGSLDSTSFFGGSGAGIGTTAVTANVIRRSGLVFDGTTAAYWLDGLRKGTEVPADVTDVLGSAIAIGLGFSGHIRNVRIYDRALSDREMAVA